MRHGKKFNHLGRKTGHRSAMLSNMACSLIEHKRINTTIAKAKALRVYIEPLITRSKDDSTHSRRMVFRQLKSKYAVAELFRDVAPKVANRPGGYTRIIKTGYRLGDNAEMCMIELVDFNELMLKETGAGKKRSRRGKKSTSTAAKATPVKTEEKVEAVEETPKAEVKKEAPKAEAKKEEVKKEAPKAEAKKPEAKKEEPKAEAKKEVKKEEPKAEAKKEEPKAKEEKPKAKKEDDQEKKED